MFYINILSYEISLHSFTGQTLKEITIKLFLFSDELNKATNVRR